jgi:hypothetical protein
MTDREKDVKILALRHQLTVLQRQPGSQRPQLRPEDRAFLAALLVPLSRATLRRLRPLVSPDTVWRWHRDPVRHRHARAGVNRGPRRPRTLASIRRPVRRLAAENPSRGYRRIHGEPALPGIKIAPSAVREIRKTDGAGPAPQRTTVPRAGFLRSRAEAILAMDLVETVTLTGQRRYILAASRHTGRRVRVLGTTAHPAPAWVTQAVRSLLMDLGDAGNLAQARFLIPDRGAKCPVLTGEILSGAGITTVLTGVRVPRMNSIAERWVKTLRAELPDRTLIWNETRLRHALHEYERHCSLHRPRRALAVAAPLRELPHPLQADRIERLAIRRHDRLGGVIHEYRHAA